jgi:hypothetical protein
MFESDPRSNSTRDAAGRWLPGQSGNPSGKTPGTRNRATLLRELLEEDEDRLIARIVVDKAKAGDAVAARFVIAHLCPRPRARTVAIALAAGASAENVVMAHDAVLRALFAGEIAPDEAEAVTRVLDARMRALRAWREEKYAITCNRGFPVMFPRPAAADAAARADGLDDDDEDEDEDEFEDEDEVEDEMEQARPAPGPATRALSAAQDEGRALKLAPSPHAPHPDRAREAGLSQKRAHETGPAAPLNPLHSACIHRAARAAKTAQPFAPERELIAAVGGLAPPLKTAPAAGDDPIGGEDRA